MSNTLLDLLFQKSDCMYMSDLTVRERCNISEAVLEGIKDDEYSLECWNDTVSYITKCSSSFKTKDEAKKYLKSWVKK